MRAVLVGSVAHGATDPGDVDLLCDSEYADMLSDALGNPTDADKSPLGLNMAWRLENGSGMLDTHVPADGTARRFVLDAFHDHGGLEERYIGPGGSAGVPPVEILAALKKAHLISPKRWERHIVRYHELKARLGVARFVPTGLAAEVFKHHRREILETAKKHPKLNQAKDGFFGDAPYEVFDHDTIHVAVARHAHGKDEPAYVQMKDGEVWCSRAKWDAMPDAERLRCVVEEACILALERSVLPALFLGKDFRGSVWAYGYALQKVCTTITSGWFRDYAIEVHDEAVAARPDYVAAFFDGLKSGLVKVKRPEALRT